MKVLLEYVSHSGRNGGSGGLRSASLHSGPSQRLLRPRKRELVSVGPLPLYLSGGGQAPGTPIPARKTAVMIENNDPR